LIANFISILNYILLVGNKPLFRKNNKTQRNPQIVEHTPHNRGPVRGGAHGPSNLRAHQADAPSGKLPPRSRAGRPLGRISASLEGWTPPRANLRLARGLDAPSGESPPRSRAGRPLGRISASLEGWMPPRANLRLARGLLTLAAPAPAPPTRELNICSDTPLVPGSKANPRHADPLTPPRNRILTLFRQPSPCGHPWHCRRTMREGQCQLRDTAPPTPIRPARRTPRKRTAEPSKRVRTLTPRPHGATP
jgi:hypothetical protein